MTLPRCLISRNPEVLRSHLEGSLAVVVLNLLIRSSEQQNSRAAILERDKQRDYKRRDNLSLVKRVHCMSTKMCLNGMSVFVCTHVAFTTTEMTKLMYHWDQLAHQLICRSAIRERNREREKQRERHKHRAALMAVFLYGHLRRSAQHLAIIPLSLFLCRQFWQSTHTFRSCTTQTWLSWDWCPSFLTVVRKHLLAH